MCLILGVGAGQRPFFMGKVIRIDFPTRTKSVSGLEASMQVDASFRSLEYVDIIQVFRQNI